MHPLTNNDVEAELSYAYLHAVTSHARASCQNSTRTMDGNGIDAILVGWSDPDNTGQPEDVYISIQLKATSVEHTIAGGNISYFFKGAARYNDMRQDTSTVPRFLVVLFLAREMESWLAIHDDQLLLRKCAYWVSLRGAPPPEDSGKTVYIPVANRFDPAALSDIFARTRREEKIYYQAP